MFDIKFIRENPEKVQQNANNKNYAHLSVAKLLELDNLRKDLQQQADTLRETRNQVAKQMKSGGKPDEKLLAEGRDIKEKLTALEENLRVAETDFTDYLKKFPNMALDSVPVGKSEAENVVAKTVGEPPKFDFTPLNHAQLAEKRGWLDVPRAVKVAGSRFVYVKGDLARLEFALWQFAIDTLTNPDEINKIRETLPAEVREKLSDKPFLFVLPPAVAKTAVF